MLAALVLAPLLSSSAGAALESKDVYALPQDDFIAQARRDLKTLRLYANGLRRLQEALQENASLLTRKDDLPYTPEQKAMLLSTWGAFFSYFSSAEAIRQRYWGFLKVPTTDTRHLWGYVLTHTALTTELAHGLVFADKTAGNLQLEVLFDEPNAEFGVPAKAFTEFKVKSIHIGTTTQLFTGDEYGQRMLSLMRKNKLLDQTDVVWATREMRFNSKTARRKLSRRGINLFVRQAGDVVSDSAAGAIFPVQKGVAAWMGDTRVRRVGQPLIRREQVEPLLARLEPGDIMVARQNWFLSNVGLPGFWPHAELYVGTPAVLAAYFDGDEQVKAWLSTRMAGVDTFTAFLEARYPDQWKQYASGKDLVDAAPIRIIESVSEGVSLTAIEHGMLVDYLGVMRPRLPKVEKAQAIARAFGFIGRPYDFDFDFRSDAALVCTELVWKSYAPSAAMKGLRLPLVMVAGRQTLPANEIVRVFDLELDKPDRQLDFVAFLEGNEAGKTAVARDATEFRKSHLRVKWDVAQR